MARIPEQRVPDYSLLRRNRAVPQEPMFMPQEPMFMPEEPMAEVTPYIPPTSVSGVIAELEAQNNPVPRISHQAPPSGGVDDYVPPAPPYSPPTTSYDGVDDYVPNWPTINPNVNIFVINDTGDDIGEEVIDPTTFYEPPPFTPPTPPVAPPVVGTQPKMPMPKTAVQLALEAGANRPKGPVRNFMPTVSANSGWTPGGWNLVTTNSPGSNSGGSQ